MPGVQLAQLLGRFLLRMIVLGMLAVLAGQPVAIAATTAISQSFTSSASNVAPGSILSLVNSDSGTVQPATNAGTHVSLVGVAADQPLLELTSNGQHSVQVTVSGTAQALVSDINGPIVAGDKITASPIAGVGMKAIDAGQIVGTAQASLRSVATTSQQVTDRTGKTSAVKIGLVPISVNVTYYTASSVGSLSAFVPAFLQNLANAISGKQVSPLRVLISALLLLLGSITVIVMLNAAIRSGIISIGRNPLAERALRKGLLDVILAAFGVFLVSMVIVYAVLAA